MIGRLIGLSLRNRFLVVACFALLGGWGYWALLTTPIDAIPDLSDNQVIVFTDWSGRSPQEVEDQVTYPLTVSLQELPSDRVVRCSSADGCASTRSTWIRIASAPIASPSRRWSRRPCGATATSAATWSRRAGRGPWCAVSG